MIDVYVALDAVEAMTVSSLLDDEGFDARILDLTVTPYPVSIGALGERRVVIPSDQAEPALLFLRQAAADGIIRPDGIADRR